MNNKNYIRLPMRNAYNIRDLGGYATADGGVTKFRTFLRADDLAKLDNAEQQFLLDYGVRTVIDLRSKEECEQQPNPFAVRTDVRYHNIALLDNVITEDVEVLIATAQDFIKSLYVGLVDNATDAIGAVFNAIADTDGAVLFHCAAGKDRTGVIAAILLGLVGVSETDIIANYEVTYTHIRQNPTFAGAEYHSDLMLSAREYIESVIARVKTAHGGFVQYLQADVGLTDGRVSAIREKFCDVD